MDDFTHYTGGIGAGLEFKAEVQVIILPLVNPIMRINTHGTAVLLDPMLCKALGISREWLSQADFYFSACITGLYGILAPQGGSNVQIKTRQPLL